MSTLNDTPSANRIHIGFYGKRNSGKSSLVNAFCNQKISIVSDVPGTTADPVYKAMEIYGIGPCVLIDTAGFDDEGALGEMRVNKTKEAALKTEIAVVLFPDKEISKEKEWLQYFKEKNIPVIPVISRADVNKDKEFLKSELKKYSQVVPIEISCDDKDSVNELKEALIRLLPEGFQAKSITGSLCDEGDVVMLVMPQDIQAPKGRLILPQVQTIRELLDKKCIVISTTTDKYVQGLKELKTYPKLIITDSQAFKIVYEHKPPQSLLTSFSVLFAALKGDIKYYIESAKKISTLNDKSRVLIAECCTHAPLAEDIGREKIPNMLRKKYGVGMRIDIVSGIDYPKDLSSYDLIIQCGGCMFNRKHIMSRIERAKEQNVPMTNYGVTISYLTGILDKISF